MISAILLAAGESTRMGQLKALLPWGGTTLLEYQLAELAGSLVGDVIVVLGHAAEQLDPIVRRYSARPVVNDRYREGRSMSIRVGMRALSPDATGVLITNVDQPRPRAILDMLIGTHLRRASLVSRPVHGDQHGHPTIFSRRLFDELCDVSEQSEGLKAVLRKHAPAIANVQFADAVVLLNLNRPADYEAAMAHRPPEPRRLSPS